VLVEFAGELAENDANFGIRATSSETER
jgi:hypothetical protein